MRSVAIDLQPIPYKVAGVPGRSNAFRISHQRPSFTRRIIKKESVIDRREKPALLTSSLLTGAGICEGLKTKSVRELVQQHRHQVDTIRAMIVIEPIVPMGRL